MQEGVHREDAKKIFERMETKVLSGGGDNGVGASSFDGEYDDVFKDEEDAVDVSADDDDLDVDDIDEDDLDVDNIDEDDINVDKIDEDDIDEDDYDLRLDFDGDEVEEEEEEEEEEEDGLELDSDDDEDGATDGSTYGSTSESTHGDSTAPSILFTPKGAPKTTPIASVLNALVKLELLEEHEELGKILWGVIKDGEDKNVEFLRGEIEK